MVEPDVIQWLNKHMDHGIYIVDRQRRVIYWNTNAAALSGFEPQDIIGKHCWDNLLQHSDDQHRELCRGWCPLVACMQDGKERAATMYMHQKIGQRIPIKIRAIPIRDETDRIVGAIEIFTQHQDSGGDANDVLPTALTMPFPGIPQRFFIEQRIQALLHELKRSGRAFGVIKLVVDSARQISEHYGAAVRESIMRMVITTLSQNVGLACSAGQWNEGEFIAVVNSANPEMLALLTAKLTFLVQQSFVVIENTVVRPTVATGSTIAQADDMIEPLLERIQLTPHHYAEPIGQPS